MVYIVLVSEFQKSKHVLLDPRKKSTSITNFFQKCINGGNFCV